MHSRDWVKWPWKSSPVSHYIIPSNYYLDLTFSTTFFQFSLLTYPNFKYFCWNFAFLAWKLALSSLLNFFIVKLSVHVTGRTCCFALALLTKLREKISCFYLWRVRMKLGRVALFVQFAALWKICPTFYPDSEILRKTTKKRLADSCPAETCWRLVAKFPGSACTEHVPVFMCISRLYHDQGEQEPFCAWDRKDWALLLLELSPPLSWELLWCQDWEQR